MAGCPNCNNKISSWKILFLTNFNSIHCDSCGKSIIIGNKLIGALIGAIGGAIGALVLSFAVYSSSQNTFGIKNIVLIFLWLAMVILVAPKFTKLKIKE